MQIRRRNRRSVPGLNMASMPDLIFTVLFFFMIVTHMRTETVQVKFDVPAGTEVEKVTKKFGAVDLYVGKDDNGDTRIQFDKHLLSMEQVGPVVGAIRSAQSDEDRDGMIVNLRVDKSIPMRIVNGIKLELRKAGIQKVRYVAAEEKETID